MQRVTVELWTGQGSTAADGGHGDVDAKRSGPSPLAGAPSRSSSSSSSTGGTRRAASRTAFTTWVPPSYSFAALCQDAATRWRVEACTRCEMVDRFGAAYPSTALVLDELVPPRLHVFLSVVGAASELPASPPPPGRRSSAPTPVPSARESRRRGAGVVGSDASPDVPHVSTDTHRPARAPDAGVSRRLRPLHAPVGTPEPWTPPTATPAHPLGQADELWCIFVWYSVKSSGDDLLLQERPFKQLCRHCGLSMLGVTDAEAAVVYRRHTNGAHKMTFEKFLDALADLAFRMRPDAATAAAAAATASGNEDDRAPPPTEPHLVLGLFLVHHVLPNAGRVAWGPDNAEWSALSSHLRSDDARELIVTYARPLHAIFMFYVQRTRSFNTFMSKQAAAAEAREGTWLDFTAFRHFATDFGLLDFECGMRDFNVLFAMCAADGGRALGKRTLRILDLEVQQPGSLVAAACATALAPSPGGNGGNGGNGGALLSSKDPLDIASMRFASFVEAIFFLGFSGFEERCALPSLAALTVESDEAGFRCLKQTLVHMRQQSRSNLVARAQSHGHHGERQPTGLSSHAQTLIGGHRRSLEYVTRLKACARAFWILVERQIREDGNVVNYLEDYLLAAPPDRVTVSTARQPQQPSRNGSRMGWRGHTTGSEAAARTTARADKDMYLRQYKVRRQRDARESGADVRDRRLHLAYRDRSRAGHERVYGAIRTVYLDHQEREKAAAAAAAAEVAAAAHDQKQDHARKTRQDARAQRVEARRTHLPRGKTTVTERSSNRDDRRPSRRRRLRMTRKGSSNDRRKQNAQPTPDELCSTAEHLFEQSSLAPRDTTTSRRQWQQQAKRLRDQAGQTYHDALLAAAAVATSGSSGRAPSVSFAVPASHPKSHQDGAHDDDDDDDDEDQGPPRAVFDKANPILRSSSGVAHGSPLLPSVLNHAQCDVLTRWARATLVSARRRLQASGHALDVDTPSIRQAIFRMESYHHHKHKLRKEHGEMRAHEHDGSDGGRSSVQGAEGVVAVRHPPMLFLTTHQERGYEGDGDTKTRPAVSGYGDAVQFRSPLTRRKLLVDLLENDILPAVSLARYLFSAALSWQQQHYHTQHADAEATHETAAARISAMELALALSHVARTLSLEASLLFVSHEFRHLIAPVSPRDTQALMHTRHARQRVRSSWRGTYGSDRGNGKASGRSVSPRVARASGSPSEQRDTSPSTDNNDEEDDNDEDEFERVHPRTRQTSASIGSAGSAASITSVASLVFSTGEDGFLFDSILGAGGLVPSVDSMGGLPGHVSARYTAAANIGVSTSRNQVPLVSDDQNLLPDKKTPPADGGIGIDVAEGLYTSQWKRRRAVVFRWTALLSWSCRYHSQATALCPRWTACLSNSAISLYRLATMGELQTLLTEEGVSGDAVSVNGSDLDDTYGVGLGGGDDSRRSDGEERDEQGAQLDAGCSDMPSPRKRSGSAISAISAISVEKDAEELSEGGGEVPGDERPSRKGSAASDPRSLPEDDLYMMQADVNSRIRQLLKLALDTINRALDASHDKHDVGEGSTSTDFSSYAAAKAFLQAELFLRSFVFSMHATVVQNRETEPDDEPKGRASLEEAHGSEPVDDDATDGKQYPGAGGHTPRASQNTVWRISVSENGRRAIDGLRRRYDRDHRTGDLTPLGLASFTQDVIGDYSEAGEDDHAAHLETGAVSGASLLLYEHCCAQFGSLPLHDAVVVEGAAAAAAAVQKQASSETASGVVAAHASEEVDDRDVDVEEDAEDNSHILCLDAMGFRRLVAYRAMCDPVPLWRLLQRSVAAAAAGHRGIVGHRRHLLSGSSSFSSSFSMGMRDLRDELSFDSGEGQDNDEAAGVRGLLDSISAVSHLRKYRSARHFSASSGLAGMPMLDAMAVEEEEAEVQRLRELLEFERAEEEERRLKRADRAAAERDPGRTTRERGAEAGVSQNDGSASPSSGSSSKSSSKSSSSSNSSSNVPKPTKLAIRRDSRKLSHDMISEISDYLGDESNALMKDDMRTPSSPSSSSSSASSSPSGAREVGAAAEAGQDPASMKGSSSGGSGGPGAVGSASWKKARKLLYKSATKLLWTVRFVDYCCLMGTGPPTPQSIRDSRGPADLEVEPTLLDTVPREPGHPDMPLPPELAAFCCPNGMHLRTKDMGIPPPTHFAQVLAVGTVGTTVYCCCVHFYDRLDPHELLAMFTSARRGARGGDGSRAGSPASAASSRSGSPGSEHEGENSATPQPPDFPEWLDLVNLDSNPVVYAPKCLVILSHWPFLSTFKRFLCQVLRIRRQGPRLLRSSGHPPHLQHHLGGSSATKSLLPVERYISNFIFDVPLPPRGRTRVQYSIAESTMLICRPPDYELPLCDLPIKPLFQCLSVSNVLTILGYLLTERSIAVCSRHAALLAPALEALRLLIFPFHWQCTYIPILPQRWYEFLYAPVPFLMGLNVDFGSEEARELHRMDGEMIVFVDLDRNEIMVPRAAHEARGSGRSKAPRLPEHLRRKLVGRLKKCVGRGVFNSKCRDIALSDLCYQGDGNTFLHTGLPLNEEDLRRQGGQMIRTAGLDSGAGADADALNPFSNLITSSSSSMPNLGVGHSDGSAGITQPFQSPRRRGQTVTSIVSSGASRSSGMSDGTRSTGGSGGGGGGGGGGDSGNIGFNRFSNSRTKSHLPLEESLAFSTKGVREAFLQFFVCLLSTYRRAYSKPIEGSDKGDAASVLNQAGVLRVGETGGKERQWDKKQFLHEQSRSTQAGRDSRDFLSQLLETQLFEDFVRTHAPRDTVDSGADSSGSGSRSAQGVVAASAVNQQPAEVRLFDEYILEFKASHSRSFRRKLDRSRESHGNTMTPLLDARRNSPSPFVETYVCTPPSRDGLASWWQHQELRRMVGDGMRAMHDPDESDHAASTAVSLIDAPDVDGSRCEPFPERLDPRMFGPMRPHQYLIGADSITRPMRRLLEAVRTRHTLSAHVTKKATHMHQRHEMRRSRSSSRTGSRNSSPTPPHSPTYSDGAVRRRRSSLSLDSSSSFGSRPASPSLNGPTRRLARRNSFLNSKTAVPSPSAMAASLTSALGSGSSAAAVAAAHRHRLLDESGTILSPTAWAMRDTLSFLKTVLDDCVERALRECGQRHVDRCHERIQALEEEVRRMSRETREREAREAAEEKQREERRIMALDREKREAQAAAEAAAAAAAAAAAEAEAAKAEAAAEAEAAAAARAAAAAAAKVAAVVPDVPNAMSVPQEASSFWAAMWHTSGALAVAPPRGVTGAHGAAEMKTVVDTPPEGWDSPSAELQSVLSRRRRLSESKLDRPPAGPPPPTGAAALIGLREW